MKSSLWIKVRAASQIVFWLLFIGLIAFMRDPVGDGDYYNIFTRLSAHLAITTSLSAGKIITAYYPTVIIVLLTIILGRFFCGWVCPLGSTIDVADKTTGKNKINYLSFKGKKKKIKHYKITILVVSLLLAVAGINISGIIDPMSLAPRSYAVAVYPYIDYILKSIFLFLAGIPFFQAVFSPLNDFLSSTVFSFADIFYSNQIQIVIMFLSILAFSAFARRFWCQALCPLGAVFYLTAKIPFFRRIVDRDKCTGCGSCVSECRMNAISESGTGTAYGECIECMDCISSCRYGAVSFDFRLPDLRRRAPADDPIPDAGYTRKNFLAGFIAAGIVLPALKLDAAFRSDSADILRPPGALTEDKFVDLCVRCSDCIKVCPTGALHPAMFDAGTEALFTPKMMPRLGYCEFNCNLCTKICPTDAIKKISLEEKQSFVIGTAVIDRNLCFPWADGQDCIVCEEVCPVARKAVKFQRADVFDGKGKKVTVKGPYVAKDLCIGCGICENKCPVPGRSAIRVRKSKII